MAGALAASLLYSVGAALQALEAQRAPPEDALRASLLRRLVGRPVWIGGTACVVVAWALQAGSLLFAPVTVVQPILALGLVALIVIGARVLDEQTSRREILAVAAIVVGVVGLVLTAPGDSGGQADPVVLAPAMAGLGLLALAPYALRSSGPQLVLVVLAVVRLRVVRTGNVVRGRRPVGGAVVGAPALAGRDRRGGRPRAGQRDDRVSTPVTRVFPVILVVQIVVAVGLAPLLGRGELGGHAAGDRRARGVAGRGRRRGRVPDRDVERRSCTRDRDEGRRRRGGDRRQRCPRLIDAAREAPVRRGVPFWETAAL